MVMGMRMEAKVLWRGDWGGYSWREGARWLDRRRGSRGRVLKARGSRGGRRGVRGVVVFGVCWGV